MGFIIDSKNINLWLSDLQKDHAVFAPTRFVGGSRFSDADCIRYAKISKIEDIEFGEKSLYSFKEAIFPIIQTLFYYTQNEVIHPDYSGNKAVIFLRSCDLHLLLCVCVCYAFTVVNIKCKERHAPVARIQPVLIHIVASKQHFS